MPHDPSNCRESTVLGRCLRRLWQLTRAVLYREFLDRRQERAVSGFLVSLVIHLGVLLVLALWGIFAMEKQVGQRWLISVNNEPVKIEQLDLTINVKAPEQQSADHNQTQEATATQAPNIPSPFAGLASDPVERNDRVADHFDKLAKLLRPTWLPTGGGYEGRTKQMRTKLAQTRGGTKASEDAVEFGLAWLAAHQRNDGGWRFDHHKGPCKGRCRDPGTNGSTTGATGIALLAFLGAGYTHKTGKYNEVVHRGLYYLMSSGTPTANGVDFQEGSMYGHGIASLALCEAYAMTKDKQILRWAQGALDFICFAQHPAGGWRYNPGQPGDTTVFGWQIMAIKSGRMKGLDVPSPVITAAKRYLDSVQTERGAYYGYIKKGKLPTPTAIGLLTRMYSKWPRTDKRLARGIRYLATKGPSDHDMYFNYYATQVLHHYEGPLWKKWNQRLRDYLVKNQAMQKHEKGSWYFKDRHGKEGGRLYTTAMCVMILEVYYRHMPLYDVKAVQRGF